MGNASQMLEALMLVCFGVSWPLDIINTLRKRQSGGKSQVFMAVIVAGYLAGVAAKVLAARADARPLPPVLWLYLVNIALVAADMAVTWRYRNGGKP